MSRESQFLTAEWRYLAMLNYEVDPALLIPVVPRGTELDRWEGRVFVSLVGFRFLKTKVFGVSIPFHSNFDEVNLRFYVRRQEGVESRRGVVFIREIVPRFAIASVARAVYNENYIALPMGHEVRHDGSEVSAAYRWKSAGGWCSMSVHGSGPPQALREGSEEQFITEHYWGYAAQRDGSTVEYRVEHPSWKVWKASAARFEGNVAQLYGREFASLLSRPPASAFLAEGSEVNVMRGRTI